MSSPDLARVIEHGSKSFALASKLLPRACRRDVAIVYAYCRNADDAVDEAPRHEREGRVQALFDELASVYAGAPQPTRLLVEFQRVVQTYAIPERYPRALLEGMRTDLGSVRVADDPELLLYAHRVAGVVGLILCRLFGVNDERALGNANDLGIAMQLTNICRDVEQDFRRDRVYLPAELLRRCDCPELDAPTGDLSLARPSLARAVQRLLALADRYYASGDAGLHALPFRVALAVRSARLVYAEIGAEIARKGYDVLAGRAVVPWSRKIALVLRAVIAEAMARVKPRSAPPALGPGASDAL